MAPVKCTVCEDRFGKAPIEPCAACKVFIDRFAGKSEIKEIDKISELVAENAALKNELGKLRAIQAELEKLRAFQDKFDKLKAALKELEQLKS